MLLALAIIQSRPGLDLLVLGSKVHLDVAEFSQIKTILNLTEFAKKNVRMTSSAILIPQESCEATGRDLCHIRVGGDPGRGGEEGADAGGGQDQGEAA